jgi:endonuclease-3
MKKIPFNRIFKYLNEAYSFVPVINKLSNLKNPDPFRILVTTMLSSRTKDETTEYASQRLFNIISRPEDILNTNVKNIREAIFPVGFYKTKTKNLIKLSETIIKKYKGKVPDNINDLTSLPGVGVKTATLVLSEAFGKNEICVDTHVHRISNRLGIVNTKKPEQTMLELKKVLPVKHWKSINNLMVSFGKTICKPVRPLCHECKLCDICMYYNTVVRPSNLDKKHS